MTAKQVLAFSGGKDSTCLALVMADDGEDFELFFTPTGRELPELLSHIARIVTLTKRRLVVRTCGTGFTEIIKGYNALPNNRQRWCTRQLKIEPCIAYLLENPGSVLCVGLRADEEHRAGLYGEFATYRYPLREKGMKKKDVYAYLDRRGICVPERTDCDWCYDQRLGEWWKLWSNYPERYAEAEALEKLTGHTFRSPTRDTWPRSLEEMRKRFEAGDLPQGMRSLPLFGEVVDTKSERCRVCSL